MYVCIYVVVSVVLVMVLEGFYVGLYGVGFFFFYLYIFGLEYVWINVF